MRWDETHLEEGWPGIESCYELIDQANNTLTGDCGMYMAGQEFEGIFKEQGEKQTWPFVMGLCNLVLALTQFPLIYMEWYGLTLHNSFEISYACLNTVFSIL